MAIGFIDNIELTDWYSLDKRVGPYVGVFGYKALITLIKCTEYETDGVATATYAIMHIKC